MSSPFLLEIPPRGQIEEIGLHDRRQFVGYHGDPECVRAVESVLKSLEEFAGHRANLPAISAALTRFAPELMAIATVLVLNQLPKMEADDAEPLLRKMRELGQPEWMRAIAGNIRLFRELDDQHAVCDASEVDDRPGQDAGEALIGVECWIWDTLDESHPNYHVHGIESADHRGPRKIERANDKGYSHDGGYFQHARPIYLGRPTP